MRSQRLTVLLATAIIVCFSLVLLRRSSSSNGSLNVSPLPPPRNPAPSPPSQLSDEDSTIQGGPHPIDTQAHPISSLVQDAEERFSQLRSHQSKTLGDAVDEYRNRYGMNPPPHFDKWFHFAQSKGCQLIDEYDTIYHSLLPFWALEPKTIRERAHEALGFDNSMLGVLIRDGKVTHVEGGTEEQRWQREATSGMLEEFIQYLPDMDLIFNAHDEPRVIVPSEDLQRLVQIAKDEAIPNAFQKQSPVNSWSPRPIDLNKGDRIDEVRTTRFNRFAHQPTWTNSRSSCPVNSPARSLDEDIPDKTNGYAYGELGFVYNTTAFSDICNTPSLRRKYGFFDRANAFDVVRDLFPIFSQSKISSFQDILYPSPWYWADQVPYIPERDVSWDEKEDKMYWRGTTTGGFSRAGGWRRHHRQRFVSNVNALNTAKTLHQNDNGQWETKEVNRHSYQDMFNVTFTGIGQCDKNDCAAQREYFKIGPSTGQQDAWAFKHLADIDGNAFSGRFYAFLRSNSLVYKIALFREWHDEWLKPWVHYVPLSLSGNEHVEAMRYFVSENEGKVAAPRLAQQGQEWAQKSLRNQDMEVWLFRLLLEYGRLVDDNRENLGYSL
ncbi:capsule-associated protein CAP1 [Aspergillus nanangensis]|uniref:Capsule-associated protein CAP1 n=1 Tax=Aspergillus nanangensis TaxID=2582783 RepID=A0AAD4D134_ASPNN|nr:capsule-associated protein CAP1 [Aspergillus nanangensis]